MRDTNQKLKVALLTNFPDLMIPPLMKSNHQLVGVIEYGSIKKGRIKSILRQVFWLLSKRKLVPNIKKLCEKNHIKYRAEGLKLSEELPQWLEKLSADVIVLYSAPLISQKIIDTAKIGCLNIHPSLLPKYRGPRPISWMAKDFDLEGGSSVFFVAKKSDTGDIVSQKKFSINPGLSHYQTGVESLQQCGLPALLEALDAISKGTHQRIVQPENSPTAYAKHCSNQEYWDFIDWQQWPMQHTWHFMRCLPFWNIQLNKLSGWKKYLEWEICNYEHTNTSLHTPGNLVENGNKLYFAHKEGQINLKPVLNPLKIAKKLITHKKSSAPADLTTAIRRPKISELGDLFFAACKALPTTVDYKLARYLVTAHEHECFILLEGRKIAAFCFYGLNPETKTLWFNYFGTDPDCRSKGYGNLMLSFLENFASENGYNKTAIIIHLFKATNVGAQKFFSREGYEKFAIEGNEKSVHYIKTLPNQKSEIKIRSEKKSFMAKTIKLGILSLEIIKLISSK